MIHKGLRRFIEDDDSSGLPAKTLARFVRNFTMSIVRSVKAKRVQVDEIWSFNNAKDKNVATVKAAPDVAGDVWTWTALEAETKLIVSFFVGGRDGDCAKWFMDDVAARLAIRLQLTSDGHKPYLDAVEGAFGADVDYAQLVKLYGASPESMKGRYSPAECTGTTKTHICSQSLSGDFIWDYKSF